MDSSEQDLDAQGGDAPVLKSPSISDRLQGEDAKAEFTNSPAQKKRVLPRSGDIEVNREFAEFVVWLVDGKGKQFGYTQTMVAPTSSFPEWRKIANEPKRETSSFNVAPRTLIKVCTAVGLWPHMDPSLPGIGPAGRAIYQRFEKEFATLRPNTEILAEWKNERQEQRKAPAETLPSTDAGQRDQHAGQAGLGPQEPWPVDPASQAHVPATHALRFHPLALFTDWDEWKNKMALELSDDEHLGAADHAFMAQFLLHGIQPAFYREALPELRRLAKQVSANDYHRNPPAELADACTIVRAACEFYAIMDRNDGGSETEGLEHGDHHRLVDFFNSLQSRMRTRIDSNFFRWLNAILLNFLGLSRYELYRSDPDKARRFDQLKFAASDLESSLRQFEAAAKASSDYKYASQMWINYVDLWEGYVYRNLGAAYEAIAEASEDERGISEATGESRLNYENALERRERVLVLLGDKLPGQFHFETELVKMDMMRLKGRADTRGRDRNNLTQIWNYLKRARPRLPVFWEHALVHVQKTAKILEHHAVAADVKAILSRERIESRPSSSRRLPSEPRTIVLSLLTWNTKNVSRASAYALWREAQFLQYMGHNPFLCFTDNGSDDGTQDVLQELEGELERRSQLALKLRQDLQINGQGELEPQSDLPTGRWCFKYERTNLGASIARDRIIEYMIGVGAHYVLMIDGDIEVVPFSSLAMLQHMEKSSNDRVGCLGVHKKCCTTNRAHVNRCLLGIDGAAVQKEQFYAWTQYGMFRREVFTRGVNFRRADIEPDVEIFAGPGWGFEDVDLAFQMQANRFEIQHFDDVTYLHRHVGSSLKNLQELGVDVYGIHEARREWMLKKWKGKIPEDLLMRVRQEPFPAE